MDGNGGRGDHRVPRWWQRREETGVYICIIMYLLCVMILYLILCVTWIMSTGLDEYYSTVMTASLKNTLWNDCFVLQFLVPGIDNSLSSYMNQRSVDGKIWRRRWFVLINRTLICYDSHLVSNQKACSEYLWLYLTFWIEWWSCRSHTPHWLHPLTANSGMSVSHSKECLI